MSDVVLDASAMLAVLNGEPGADEVWDHLPGARLSAVNAAEVAAKLVDGGIDAEEAGQTLTRLGARIAPFEEADVVPAAHIRAATRSAGLSLGDRACLALARRLGLPALTADRQWRDIQVDVEVRLIRG
jgi:PIN domain nuclease of toxin-antitoxin system